MPSYRVNVAVIGGGIVGLGIAAELSSLGKTVCLLEKDKLSTKASGNSLRIIHGGLRYLQNANIVRTLESSKAQADLVQKYPEHIKPLKCVMPLDRWGFKSRLPASIAIAAYRLMAKFYSGRDPGGEVLNSEASIKLSKLLSGISDNGVLQWFDALVLDPAAFAETLVGELRQQGVEVREKSFVESVAENGSGFTLEVSKDGEKKHIACEKLVDASGAWITKASKGDLAAQQTWCKAYNIVLNRQLEPEVALGLKSSSGRLYFLVPREDYSVLGTFYTRYDQDPDEASVSDPEVEYHLEEFNKLCPAADLTLSDVGGLDIGVLPFGSQTGEHVEPLGSEQVIKEGNLLTVVSTKYTTFEVLARKVARCL